MHTGFNLGRALCVVLCAQTARSQDFDDSSPAWRLVEALPVGVTAAQREPGVRPDLFQPCVLDVAAFTQDLRDIPAEHNRAAAPAKVMALPMPDGHLARFAVFESPIMAPELAAKFPEIRTFAGQGIDDPAASVRFDWTPHGFHAQVLSPRGAVYIDPYWRGNTTAYASYWKRDHARAAAFTCLFRDDANHEIVQAPLATTASADAYLRTYRLACAATGEYTQFHGGTVSGGLAAIVTAINRVTGIYETDFGVRMVLVSNNDQLVYTNAATDPYSNFDVSTMLDQNQATVDSVIGSGNYDVGHVFGTGGGGVAGLGVVCANGFKAFGVSGQPGPVGDPFAVDYVAHEMGHQFGANHTYNGNKGSCCCSRHAATAYEPGSGSTIMAYAGICAADDLQPNSDPFFHSASLSEITSFVTIGSGGACAQFTLMDNSPPTVSAGPDYTIPRGTPFALLAEGDDPNGDAVTFSWEQRDLGAAQTLSQADNGQSPILRAWDPTVDPQRTFPRLSDLLGNTLAPGEKLPNLNRTMDFRVIARDNRAGGGLTAADDMVVVVSASTGPFAVTRPNTAEVLSGLQLVTWNVAGTDLPPIDATQVDVLLSTDGGLTFPMVLASATDNDGEELVSLPEMNTVTARVKVQAVGNIFFDISNVNFVIEPCLAAAAPEAEPAGQSKNRVLSILPGNGQTPVALRVVPTQLPSPLAGMLGSTWWAGAPQLLTDAPVGATFWAATLQCEPYFAEWSEVDVLHLFGAPIVPDAEYEVIAVHCHPDDPAGYSPALMVTTTTWGDVAEPYYAGTDGQPDVLDISATVDRVKGLPGSIAKVHASVQPEAVDPAVGSNVLDIAAVVDAVKGFAYPYPGVPPCEP